MNSSYTVLALSVLQLSLATTATATLQTVFQNVNVVPMDRETVLTDQTVLVEGDRIVRMDAAGAFVPPAGATVIDGRGLFLMPGLADLHIHLNGVRADLTLYLANGITTVRVMAGTRIDLIMRRRIEAGQLLGPAIYSAGAIIDGDPPIWPGSAVVTDSAAADSVIRAHQEAGFDFVKVYERLTPDMYGALLAAAHRHGIPAVGHVPGGMHLADVIPSRPASIEHLTGFRRSNRPDNPPIPVARNHLPDSVNRARIDEIGNRMAAGEFTADQFVDSVRLRQHAEAMRDGGIWNTPTLTVLRARFYTHDEHAEILERPELALVNPLIRGTWDRQAEGRLSLGRDFIIRNTRQARAWMVEEDIFVRALRDAGAGILLGTDAPNPWVIPGYAIHEELAKLVHAGLTPYEALAAGTVNAAEFLGGADEFGRVAPGLRADLVLLEGNPLEDVGYAAQIRGVMVRGQWLPRTELDSMLQAVRDEYGASRD